VESCVTLEGFDKVVKIPSKKSNRWERLIPFYGLDIAWLVTETEDFILQTVPTVPFYISDGTYRPILYMVAAIKRELRASKNASTGLSHAILLCFMARA